MTPPVRQAATVIVVREASPGFQVFMVRRNRAVAFMPHAWVFPGGRVDEADARIAADLGEHVEPGADPGGPAAAIRVAAARETFEESGIWLGLLPPTPAERVRLNSRPPTLSLADLLRVPGRTLELGRLRPWSRWITPAEEPRRYDTWFFLAEVGQVDARHDAGETVDSAWLPIDEAVASAEAGRLPMAPPTWWTLRQLQQARDLDGLRSAPVDLRPITPVLESGPDGLALLLPGHERHPAPPREHLPSRITFAQGRWWAEGG